MIWSLLKGSAAGVVAGGVAVSALTLGVGQPVRNDNVPDKPLVLAPIAAAEIEEDAAPLVQESASDVVTAAVQPEPAMPAAREDTPSADTTSIDIPVVDVAEVVTDALIAPEPNVAPELDLSGDDPVLPNPQSLVPQVPIAEADIVVSTDTTTPAPAMVVEDVVVVEDEQEVVVEATQIDAETLDIRDAEMPSDDVVVEVEEVMPPVEAAPEIMAEAAPEETPAPMAEETDGVEVDAPEVIDVSETEAALEAVTDVVEAPKDEATIDDTATDLDVADVIVTDLVDPNEPIVVSILDRDTASALPTGTGQVKVNRSLGQATTVSDETPAATVAVDPDATALERFATAFDNTDGKPLLSILLIDEGDVSDPALAMSAVPFAMTAVLDPTRNGIADQMASYRSAGIEVAMKSVLPRGAIVTDVAVTMEAILAAVPQAVALVDVSGDSIQASRDIAEETALSLSASGLGLVVGSVGLNPGLRAAADANVPATTVYREFDASGQDIRAMGRFLDQAAFQARQKGSVVLVGRLRHDTIAALIAWGNSQRAQQVAIAPLSAVLLSQ